MSRWAGQIPAGCLVRTSLVPCLLSVSLLSCSPPAAFSGLGFFALSWLGAGGSCLWTPLHVWRDVAEGEPPPAQRRGPGDPGQERESGPPGLRPRAQLSCPGGSGPRCSGPGAAAAQCPLDPKPGLLSVPLCLVDLQRSKEVRFLLAEGGSLHGGWWIHLQLLGGVGLGWALDFPFLPSSGCFPVPTSHW